jgi:succinate dehydrogenase hydrophobic anchor subunit
MSVVIETPNSPRTRKQANWEKYGWLFMRVSGPLLIVLVFTHLVVNLVLGEGIKAIDFAFVAGKWADPFWQWWDIAMLWLAMIHGTNGMRTIVNDYTERVQGANRTEHLALGSLCTFDCAGHPGYLHLRPMPSGSRCGVCFHLSVPHRN